MTDMLDLLVIGGGPAGLSAARAYRDAGGDGRVGIVTDEHRMPYRRPPLTKDLLRGDSTEADLPLEEESWLAARDVLLICGRATALDPDARKVSLSGGRELGYRRCLLATGAEPTRLPVPGADDPAVRVVRSLDHVRELQRRLSRGEAVVVIGSGFIGCEIAASLCMRGHRVGLVSDESAPNAGRLGDEAAAVLAGWLEEQGVTLHLGTEVERIARDGCALEVVASGGTRVRGEVVVMAAGVAPRGELAASAGIELVDGAIPVSAMMQSTQPDVLAAGDVCRAENVAAGRSLRVEHWGDALKQGELAGANAAGESVTWADVPGFWSTIGQRTLKYAAWGDGYDQARVVAHDNGAFTAWYGRDRQIVGVLTHGADDDYERGQKLIAEGTAWS
jgi:3-phenylpropionate/trans-cinnamate dioxygenase ferredoxin reductase component